MQAIGRWAAPSTSRMTPPTPVLAPPNGSTADGWLWVSALRAIVVPGDERDDAGVADERRAHERRGDACRWRRAAGRAGRPSPSAVVIAARNVLWAQCSLHVWASVSSSTSVGSRPSGGEVVADDGQLLGVEGQRRARRRGGPGASSSRPRTAIDLDGRGRRRSRGAGRASAGPVVQCSMIGLATRRRSSVSVVRAGRAARCAGRWPRRSRRRRAGGRRGRTASAAPSVTPGCSVISMPSPSGTSHVPVCSSGSARNAPSRSRPASSRSPSTNTTSATPTAPSSGDAERRRTGGDGGRPGVGVAGPHREPVDRSGAGRHCPDPTAAQPPGPGL